MRIVFIGPPGAGKGTQAKLAARSLGIPHISTGDMLRAAVAKGTAAGKDAATYMNAGKLVPDPVVLRMLEDRLKECDVAPGFILDGYPRNVDQAEALSTLTPVDRVVYFQIRLEDLLERLVERRVCPKCNSVYNLRSHPPQKAGFCDNDATPLGQRPDDRKEVVEARFRTYEEQTAPLIDHYTQKGLLVKVTAWGDPAAIQTRVLEVLRA